MLIYALYKQLANNIIVILSTKLVILQYLTYFYDMEIQDCKGIALVAHDNKKFELIDWLKRNKASLTQHKLYGTGTTGGLIEQHVGLSVEKFNSGPLGGDQQIGAKISEGEITLLIFFWDPLQAMPHDSDVKALIRIAAVYNIPVACNIATADFLVSSPYFTTSYARKIADFSSYKNRSIPAE